MRLKWLALSALASVAACGGVWHPIDDSALVRSKPRSLLIVYTPNESFMGPNRSPFLGGIVGAIAMAQLGHDIYVDHRLVDPTRKVGETAGARFAQHHGLSVASIVAKRPEYRREAGPPPRPLLPAADLVLEVETREWGLGSSGLGSTSVFYGMRATLTDARTRVVIADGYCTNEGRVKVQQAANVAFEDAFNQDALFIKNELSIAERICSATIATKLLLVPAAAGGG
jgi:hypothetical protein